MERTAALISGRGTPWIPQHAGGGMRGQCPLNPGGLGLQGGSLTFPRLVSSVSELVKIPLSSVNMLHHYWPCGEKPQEVASRCHFKVYN